MNSIFFSTEYLSLNQLIKEFIGLIGISIGFIWILVTIITSSKSKSKLSLKIRINLNVLLSLGILMIVFSIYISILYYLNGTHTFTWLEFIWNLDNIYLRMLPQILLFFTIIVVFITDYYKMSNLLKK